MGLETNRRRMESGKQGRLFMNEDEKDGILRLITDLFLTVGNGYSKAEKAIWLSFRKKIKTSTYNNYMSTIMRTTFRAIEDFITKHCGLQIRPITSVQDKEIRTPMVNCRKWMTSMQIQTLFKFIRLAIKKQQQPISNQEAIDLYTQLNSLIKDVNLKTIILNKKKANIHLQNIHLSSTRNNPKVIQDKCNSDLIKEDQANFFKKEEFLERHVQKDDQNLSQKFLQSQTPIVNSQDPVENRISCIGSQKQLYK